MRKVIVVILAVLALTVGMAVPAFAAPSVDVTITANPAYITIANVITTWTLNDLVGDGVTPKGFISPNTTYYANPAGDAGTPSDPVTDAQCRFTVDPTGSSLNVDLKVNCGNFTGGGAIMPNSNNGSNSATEFGGYSYCTGMTYSSGKVVMAATGSTAMKTNLDKATPIKWGAAIKTRSNAWTTSGASTTTMTITATATP